MLTVLAACSALAFHGAVPAAAGPADEPAPTRRTIWVEQLNMCMWGSLQFPDAAPTFCWYNRFTRAADPAWEPENDPAWLAEERYIALTKRHFLLAHIRNLQATDHAPDLIAVNEACEYDLVDVARYTGYTALQVGLGTDRWHEPRQCSLGRGNQTNVVLTRDANEFLPLQSGYLIEQGFHSYICAGVRIADSAWPWFRFCTAHLQSVGAGNTIRKREVNEEECAALETILATPPPGYEDLTGTMTVFAGDLNRYRFISDCAPDGFHGLKDLEETPEAHKANPTDGAQHIYYSHSAAEFSRRSCGSMSTVQPPGITDHSAFRLDLGSAPADPPPCWRSTEGLTKQYYGGPLDGK